MLIHPRKDTPTALTTDASGETVGAVLHQWIHGAWLPLAFFSKQVCPAEKKYSTFDKDLSALCLGIRHFRYMYFLEGRVFTAYTVCKPLTFSMANLSNPWTSQQQRHLAYIFEFTTNIQHIHGKHNQVADALSRAAVESINEGMVFEAMAASQKMSPNVQAYRTALSGLQLEDVPFRSRSNTILCDTSTGQPRPVVPEGWRRQVFDVIHGLSHRSMHTSRSLIASKYVWHALNKQVRGLGQSLHPMPSIQSSIAHQSTLAVIPDAWSSFQSHPHRLRQPTTSLRGVHPPPSCGQLFHEVAREHPAWRSNCHTCTCTQALIIYWISRFGDPVHVSSDRGTQCTSQLWSSILQLLGMQLHHTIAYHRQSNCLVEHYHRHLKAAVRACLSGPGWTRDIPWVLLGIRTAPKEDLVCSSAELVYGHPLTVPENFISNPDHPVDTTSGFFH